MVAVASGLSDKSQVLNSVFQQVLHLYIIPELQECGLLIGSMHIS
jgi:hypothetical protein